MQIECRNNEYCKCGSTGCPAICMKGFYKIETYGTKGTPKPPANEGEV